MQAVHTKLVYNFLKLGVQTQLTGHLVANTELNTSEKCHIFLITLICQLASNSPRSVIPPLGDFSTNRI